MTRSLPTFHTVRMPEHPCMSANSPQHCFAAEAGTSAALAWLDAERAQGLGSHPAIALAVRRSVLRHRANAFLYEMLAGLRGAHHGR